MSSPVTEVRLLTVPLDSTNKNQIWFNNPTDQYNYFIGKTRHTFDNCIFQRWNKRFRAQGNYNDLIDSNYIMFTNETKWVYGYITNLEYINENLTWVYFEIDPFQTWLFDVTFMQSFVMREHVNNDAIGANLLEEGLETGEYIYRTYEKNTDLDDIWFVVGYSDGLKNTDGTYSHDFGGLYGGLYSGLKYRAFSKQDTLLGNLTDFITSYAIAGKMDAIAMIFTIPKLFLPSVTVSGSDVPFGGIGNYVDVTPYIDRYSIDGYVPKNKKLLIYPYTFLTVNNNKGGQAVYRLERFDDGDNPVFTIGGNLAPDPTAYCMPHNYKGVAENWEHMLTMNGYPLCSWNNQIFANWVGQNSKSFLVNTAGSALAVLGGLASGNVLATGGGALGALNQLASLYQHSIQPDQARGNMIASSLNIALSRQAFYFAQMEIKREFAERIDNYFEMYGYKVNTVKVPNFTGRPYWNYVHTIDINIKGDIPANDMKALKAIFNSGVTLWHNGDNIGNYSLNNH